MTSNVIEQLTQKLSPLISQINHHPLYFEISSIKRLQLFMEQHVFAVWDFMCLLKELHRRLVSTTAPWFPPKDALSANFISSILVEEEGDITEDGSYQSHFEIYIAAMKKIGADVSSIQALLQLLIKGQKLQEAIHLIPIHAGTKKFVLTTFGFFDRPLHELAVAFVYGREGITASMFMPMLEKLESETHFRHTAQLSTLIYYLKRHIALDNEEHFPKALKMLANLIQDDPQKLQEAERAAVEALDARINFLTDIHQSFQKESVIAII